MPGQVVGKIPDFPDDATAPPVEGEQEEVKQADAGEAPEQGKDQLPAELPADQTPAGQQPPQGAPGVDSGELLKTIQGLTAERDKILEEVKTLRGERRDLKKEELVQTEKKLDDLKDLYPEDINLIERILKSRGYVTKEEANQMFYDSVKQNELEKFLEKYPEYKPSNDSNDVNWNSLQREVGLYKMPSDPHLIGQILERAHQSVSKSKVSPERDLPAKKRQAEVAGAGAGGSQRSSSKQPIPDWMREQYRRGGWSEEEINKLEQK